MSDQPTPAFATAAGMENLLNRLVTGMEHMVGALDHGAQMVPGLAGLGPILLAARSQIQEARTLLTPPEPPALQSAEPPTIEGIHGAEAMSDPQPAPPDGANGEEPPASPPSEAPPETEQPAPEPSPPPEAPPVDAPAEGPQPDHS